MQRQIKSLQQFAQLKGEERRTILRSLSDEEYNDVIKVLGKMPYIDFQVRCEGSWFFALSFLSFVVAYIICIVIFTVIDDENPTEVTTGAIVTVTVVLIRKDMSTLFGDDSVEDKNIISENGHDDGDPEPEVQTVKRPAWQKQKKGGGKKSNKKVKQKHGSKQFKSEGSPAPRKLKIKEEKVKEYDSDEVDSSDTETNDHNDRSSDDEVKNSSVEDDDQVYYLLNNYEISKLSLNINLVDFFC